MKIRHVVSAVLLLAEGLADVLESAESFDEVERGVYGLVQNVTAGVVRDVPEEMDERLMTERDTSQWEVVRGKETYRGNPVWRGTGEPAAVRDAATGTAGGGRNGPGGMWDLADGRSETGADWWRRGGLGAGVGGAVSFCGDQLPPGGGRWGW